MKSLLGSLMAVVITSSAAMATPVTLDYEGVPGDPGAFDVGGGTWLPPGNNSWDEDGFRTIGMSGVDPSSIHFGGLGSGAYTLAGDSVAVRVNNGLSTIDIFQINGNSFGVTTIGLSENCLVCGPTTGLFTGHLSGGGTVAAPYSLDGVQGPETLSLIGINAGFGNLDKLTWSTTGFGLRTQLDNVSLSTTPIPEPSQLLLLSQMALGLLGWRRLPYKRK